MSESEINLRIGNRDFKKIKQIAAQRDQIKNLKKRSRERNII